jgi:hypothetical protein
MNPKLLYQPDPPWILLHALSEGEQKWLPSYLYAMEGYSPIVRVLRGKKMRTRQGLMDEFGATLQFFEGFGENWHALKDCLSYLDEWMSGEAYILVITRPHEVLVEEPEELRWLVVTLNEVGEWWSRPITDNDRFNRSAIPFHAVLQCEEGEVASVKQRFGGPPTL